MVWRQLSIVVHDESAQLLAGLFSSLGALSVTFQDAADRPLYEPEPGQTRLWSETKVVALFDADADLSQVQAFITEQLADTALLGEWLIEHLEDREWTRCWMDHFRPMSFGDTLWVCPSGQPLPDTEASCLILDPGLAFGTGTHPTTALCLEWLADHRVDGDCVIDYGCGSGILAIAALLLGARKAFAVDIDPQALTATRDNALKNGVADRIECCTPPELPDVSADLLCANILAKPLIDLAPELALGVRRGGAILLSGILENQIDTVRQAYPPFIEFAPPALREGWGLLHGVRTGIQ
jgi:ribosomal protein L11 methyltransferase